MPQAGLALLGLTQLKGVASGESAVVIIWLGAFIERARLSFFFDGVEVHVLF